MNDKGMGSQLGYIFDQSKEDLLSKFNEWAQPSYRVRQLWHGLYKNLWESPDKFSVFPKDLVAKLNDNYSFKRLEFIKMISSSDQHTQKALFNRVDGYPVETVLMQYQNRTSLCISSQSGCAMGCVFCATGQMGYKANLSSGEIIEQVLYFARKLKREGQAGLTHIVVMGMGEPFHNFDNTIRAIDQLNDADGFNFGERRFTISTVGIPSGIRRFSKLHRQINLAVSLHAADDELRNSIIPISKKYPLNELMEACREYIESNKRRISFEWTLINGINDSVEQALKLSHLIKGMLCHVNLIPLNPTPGYEGTPSPRQRVYRFKEILDKHNIPCTVRMRRGIDIQAGCGQLAAQNK